MQKLLVSLALVICGCTPTGDPSGDPVFGFAHRGAAIHPLAVSQMVPLDPSVHGPRVVDLDDPPPINEAVEIDGARVSFDDDEPGWDEYRVYDRAGSRFLLGVTQNGGGSGVFSTVVVVEIRGDQLVPTFEAGGGDRCNGGLAGAPSFEGDAVLVPRWLTPFDLVALSTREVSSIEPYVDLESSASSCIGHALMRVEPGRDDELVSVMLDREWYGDRAGWTENYPLQRRFNRIHAEWIADGQTELDSDAIDRFVDQLLAAE